MLFSRMFLEGAAVRRRLPVGVLTAGVVALLASAGSARAALVVEIDPAATSHSDQLYSLNHPNYGDSASQSVTNLSNDASHVGSHVDDEANQFSSDETLEKLIKDCAKEGLSTMAWDLWWSITNGQDFNFTEDTENSISACLETYTTPSQVNARSTAEILTNAIAQGASEALSVNNDLYGLADWLQAVDYYYVSY
jgi:hypothetical protein